MDNQFDATPMTLNNWEGFRAVRKIPIIVHAVQMNLPEGFKVKTLEGEKYGEPGDYLIIGVNGEKYPIKREIFERTYELADKSTGMLQEAREKL